VYTRAGFVFNVAIALGASISFSRLHLFLLAIRYLPIFYFVKHKKQQSCAARSTSYFELRLSQGFKWLRF